MEKNSMGQDILIEAIQKELQAKEYYYQVSKSIKNNAARNLMLELSDEEESHAIILKKKLNKLYGIDYELDSDIALNEKFQIAMEEIHSHEHALVVVRTAIEIEDSSIEFYQNQLKTVTDPYSVDILHDLIKFEQQHKVKMEQEYKKLSQSFFWLV